MSNAVYRPRVKPTLCFVLMPFRKIFDNCYKDVIKPAVKMAGLAAIRADEIYGTKPIIQDIWRSIWQARVVVADVTSKNPNVNYELGVCHALGVPTVIISRNKKDVPFDYQHRRCIIYNLKQPGWKKKLSGDLTQTIESAMKDKDANDLKWPYDIRSSIKSMSFKFPEHYEDGFTGDLSSWVKPLFDSWKPKITDRGLELIPHNGLRNVLMLERIPFFANGQISCQVFLEQGALFDIVVRGGLLADQFYMARLDARPDWYDCFVFKPKGDWKKWWPPNSSTGKLVYHTPCRKWVNARIVASNSYLSFYRDNQLVDQIKNVQLPLGRIALFAEEANVCVRNIRINPSKKYPLSHG